MRFRFAVEECGGWCLQGMENPSRKMDIAGEEGFSMFFEDVGCNVQRMFTKILRSGRESAIPFG